MKKTFLVILGAMVVFSLPTNYVSAKPAATNAATASAIKLYKSGNYSQSYIKFSEIVKKDPSNALAYYYLGMSSIQLGRKEEGIENYNKAAALSPKGILGSYAKQGIRCAEDPYTCRTPINKSKNEDTAEDRFIKSPFGSGFSEQARGAYEKQKIESMKREINRQNEIAPQQFKDYKDFSSQVPTNDEIAQAVKTLQKAGLTNVFAGQNYNSDLSFLMGMQDDNSGFDVLNAIYTGRRSGSAGINPQVIQSLMTNQMTANF